MSAADIRARARMSGKWARCRAASTVIAGFLCSPAVADEFDTLNLVTGSSIAFDSNILRQPASANPQKDTIRTVYAGLRVDKSYSLQRFQLAFTDTRSWFNKLPERNNHTTNYRGAWLWSLTPRISGTLEATQVQRLVEGDETKNIQPNLRTTKTRNFTLDGSVFGGWHLLLGANEMKQTSEVVDIFTTNPNFQQTGGSVGAMYKTASGTSISFIQYKRKGDYLNTIVDFENLFDNHYDENESELKTTWNASGRSVLTGRLAWRARHHQHFAQRDFSGLVGSLDYDLEISGKLSLRATASRSITSVREPFASYRVDNTLTIAPKLQVSEKVSLLMSLYHSTQDYRGPVRPPPGALRRDVVQRANMSAVWAISRTASLSADLLRQQRDSNQPLNVYYDTIVTISGNFNF